MKINEFLDLPEGTVILLRPLGAGARENGAKDTLVLARLGPITPLDRIGYDIRTNTADWVPNGYIPHRIGTYRAITLTRELDRDTDRDDENAWGDPAPHRSRTTAVMARDVVGLWDNIREETLQARRIRVEERLSAQNADQARRNSEQTRTANAMEVIRPYMEAAGLTEHPAFTATSPHHKFTALEVADLIKQAQAENQPGEREDK